MIKKAPMLRPSGGIGVETMVCSAVVPARRWIKKGNVYVSSYDDARVIKFAAGTPYWKQMNINGFGDPSINANALATFRGSLYAGGGSFDLGRTAVIWKRASSGKWTAVKKDGWGTIAIPPSIIFTSLRINCTPARLIAKRRTRAALARMGAAEKSGAPKTVKMEMVVGPGEFEDWKNTEIFRMGTLNGKLCASPGATMKPTAPSCGVPPPATQVPGPKTRFLRRAMVLGTALTRFSPIFWIIRLFLCNHHQFQYRFPLSRRTNLAAAVAGGDWTQVAQGFGDPENNHAIPSLAVFNKQLYAGVRSYKESFIHALYHLRRD